MNVDNDGVAIDSNKKSGAATLSIDSSIFSGIDTVVNNNKDKVARVTLNDCLLVVAVLLPRNCIGHFTQYIKAKGNFEK